MLCALILGAPVALQNIVRNAFRRYRLYTNVQAGRSAAIRVARFINNGARQMSFYAAIAIFGTFARLTGFPSARNIIRIRTK
jgi:hypothetical protein